MSSRRVRRDRTPRPEEDRSVRTGLPPHPGEITSQDPNSYGDVESDPRRQGATDRQGLWLQLGTAAHALIMLLSERSSPRLSPKFASLTFRVKGRRALIKPDQCGTWAHRYYCACQNKPWVCLATVRAPPSFPYGAVTLTCQPHPLVPLSRRLKHNRLCYRCSSLKMRS